MKEQARDISFWRLSASLAKKKRRPRLTPLLSIRNAEKQMLQSAIGPEGLKNLLANNV